MHKTSLVAQKLVICCRASC